MGYANQRKVKIGKRAKRSRDNLFATFNLDALQEAMNNLNGSSGLLLWLYLNKNMEGYSLELSQKAAEEWGLKRDSYYRAFKELEAKGYLIVGQHGYEFRERSDNHTDNTDNQIVSVQEQQRNNTDTIDKTMVEDYDIIPEYIYNNLMDKPTDIGNGLVKLSNGRIYRREKV